MKHEPITPEAEYLIHKIADIDAIDPSLHDAVNDFKLAIRMVTTSVPRYTPRFPREIDVYVNDNPEENAVFKNISQYYRSVGLPKGSTDSYNFTSLPSYFIHYVHSAIPFIESTGTVSVTIRPPHNISHIPITFTGIDIDDPRGFTNSYPSPDNRTNALIAIDMGKSGKQSYPIFYHEILHLLSIDHPIRTGTGITSPSYLANPIFPYANLGTGETTRTVMGGYYYYEGQLKNCPLKALDFVVFLLKTRRFHDHKDLQGNFPDKLSQEDVKWTWDIVHYLHNPSSLPKDSPVTPAEIRWINQARFFCPVPTIEEMHKMQNGTLSLPELNRQLVIRTEGLKQPEWETLPELRWEDKMNPKWEKEIRSPTALERIIRDFRFLDKTQCMDEFQTSCILSGTSSTMVTLTGNTLDSMTDGEIDAKTLSSITGPFGIAFGAFYGGSKNFLPAATSSLTRCGAKYFELSPLKTELLATGAYVVTRSLVNYCLGNNTSFVQELCNSAAATLGNTVGHYLGNALGNVIWGAGSWVKKVMSSSNNIQKEKVL